MDDEDYSRACCDRCGTSVRARVVASLESGRVLCWCFHCGTRFRKALEEQGALIVELSAA